jgi:hypothetical protein
MQNWMEVAIVVETTLIAFLLSLWLAAMALRGLFHMMPIARVQAQPAASGAHKTQSGHRRTAPRVQQA